MAKLSCSYVPNKGKNTFQSLSRRYGYPTAYDVFTRVVSSPFIKQYGDQLQLDAEGVPSFESIMRIPAVRNHIGMQRVIEGHQKEQPMVDNTLSNVSMLVSQAEKFNQEDNGCLAIVDVAPNSEGKIQLQIVPDTEENRQFAENQRAVQKLNERMADILQNAGVSIDHLSAYETSLGRVGHTQFQRAQDTADGFEAIIRIANNLEGSKALSEEFAHFILGVYHAEPLVQRGINWCKNEDNARQVLGGRYKDVYEYYQGDADKIAEEAAGHMFQQALLDKANHQESPVPLFQRLVDRIVSFFRGLNPAFFRDSMSSITRDYGKLAQKVLAKEIVVTPQSIQEARRIADFNALSEKAEAQVAVLRTITENAFKAAALQGNLEAREGGLSERGSARAQAEQISTMVRKFTKQEETMAAIASFLTLAQANIKEMYAALGNLGELSVHDKFTLLRNALITIQQYAPDLDDLQNVLTEEYLSDEHIANQKFVVKDTTGELDQFESKGIKTKNLAGKSAKAAAAEIVKDSESITLSEDETYYVNKKTKQKSARVTKVIQADSEGEEFSEDSVWKTPSTNIGTGMDELTRDFFAGRLEKHKSNGKVYYTVEGRQLSEVYPNAKGAQLTKFVQQLEQLQKQFKERGITIVPRDVVVEGEIKTQDGKGITHTVSVAGTIDLLGYDRDGNWYIYDMKSHRGTISENKKDKYRRQLTLYKTFLEEKYGINVKEIGVLPIKVSYPNPKGTTNGKVTYTVSTEEASPLYNGKRNNQLLADGQPFKDANPKLEDSMIVEPIALNIEYSKLANDPTNGLGGGTMFIKQAVGDVFGQYRNFAQRFYEVAMPEFVEFLKPFVGETIAIRTQDEKGHYTGFQEVPIKSVIENCKNGDTTFMQYWLSSMADNPDALLQIFDKVVKIQKDKKRLRTIEMSQRIFALGKKYEKLGIRSYEWMFEDDKMNYINKDYDVYAYNKAKEEFWKYLDEKYGKNLRIGSQEHMARRAEEEEWYEDNTDPATDGYRTVRTPKPEKFPSKYEDLTDTQKDFYDEWMDLKAELDEIIGPEKTSLTNSIKIRKSYIERIGSVLDGTAIESFVDKVKSITQRSFDDDINYGRKGIRNFDGSEYMKLPLYFLHANVEDGRDLSTDVIGTLIAYADMAYNYDAMNEVVNPLEIGKELVKRRKVASNKREVFNFAGMSVDNPVDVPTMESNMWKLLNEFFESKVYNRYLKDNGEVAGMDVNKAASNLLKLGSTVQLGFNLLANCANLLTGLSMQNIEAAAGEHFNARILLKADGEFAKAMGAFVGDIGQRRIYSKLALFDQMFDVRQNFSSRLRDDSSFLNRNFLTRIFGPGIQYIGQDAGDHWMYNRTAIAVALQYKMYDTNTGQEVNLWDALETVPIDPENPEAGNKLVIRDGVVKENGEPLTARDISDISGKMRYINQHLFGIYNQEDAIAARRTIIGRFAMQYRDFIPAQFRYRFGKATSNLEKDDVVEGYYRTTGRFVRQLYKDFRNGEMNLKETWNELDDWEKANVKRARFEVMQFLALWAICHLMGKSAPKDRPWAVRTLRYLAFREYTELGMWVPGPTMVTEGIKIVKSPFAATNVADALTNTSGMLGLLWAPNYWTEVESGDYKGHSKAYKAFIKSPLSLWYKTAKRISEPEKAEQYYK